MLREELPCKSAFGGIEAAEAFNQRRISNETIKKTIH
jgi:hypothetical protein